MNKKKLFLVQGRVAIIFVAIMCPSVMQGAAAPVNTTGTIQQLQQELNYLKSDNGFLSMRSAIKTGYLVNAQKLMNNAIENIQGLLTRLLPHYRLALAHEAIAADEIIMIVGSRGEWRFVVKKKVAELSATIKNLIQDLLGTEGPASLQVSLSISVNIFKDLMQIMGVYQEDMLESRQRADKLNRISPAFLLKLTTTEEGTALEQERLMQYILQLIQEFAVDITTDNISEYLKASEYLDLPDQFTRAFARKFIELKFKAFTQESTVDLSKPDGNKLCITMLETLPVEIYSIIAEELFKMGIKNILFSENESVELLRNEFEKVKDKVVYYVPARPAGASDLDPIGLKNENGKYVVAACSDAGVFGYMVNMDQFIVQNKYQVTKEDLNTLWQDEEELIKFLSTLPRDWGGDAGTIVEAGLYRKRGLLKRVNYEQSCSKFLNLYALKERLDSLLLSFRQSLGIEVTVQNRLNVILNKYTQDINALLLKMGVPLTKSVLPSLGTKVIPVPLSSVKGGDEK